MRRKWVFALLFLLFPLPALGGHIALNIELEVVIPELEFPIQQVKFNDMEGDGIPEILACDGSQLVLYSVSGDSIVMSADIGSGYMNYLILFDNINRDTLHDVVFGGYKCGGLCDQWVHESLDSCQVMHFDPAHGYQRTGVRTFAWEQTMIFTHPKGIQALQAVDLDQNGWNELLISIDRRKIGFLSESTDGITEAYQSFPFGMIYERNAVTTGFQVVSDSPTGPIYLSNELNQYYSASGPDTYVDEVYCTMRDASGSYLKRLRSPADLSCLYWEQGDFVRTMRYATSGNLIVGWGGTDVLFTYSGSMSCTYVVNPDSVLFGSGSEKGQQLYRLIGTDSLQLVWENDEQYTNYIFHPHFPGYYLAFGGTSLYQFRGIDGSKHQAVGNLPEGERWWDYPYDDEIPRMIVVSGQTVKIFNLDISTATPEVLTDEPNLPHSFTVYDPYPNPFNAEVTIPIRLTVPGHLRVSVYNMLGQRVALLHDRRASVGGLSVSWDAAKFASGTYVVDVRLNNERASRRIQLVK